MCQFTLLLTALSVASPAASEVPADRIEVPGIQGIPSGGFFLEELEEPLAHEASLVGPVDRRYQCAVIYYLLPQPGRNWVRAAMDTYRPAEERPHAVLDFAGGVLSYGFIDAGGLTLDSRSWQSYEAIEHRQRSLLGVSLSVRFGAGSVT